MRKSNEEKIADYIADHIADLRVDLDQVGLYLARGTPRVVQNRLIVILEAMLEEREVKIDRTRSNSVWE